jgi:hypothetical protein
MKIVTSYKLRVTGYELRTIILTLLLSYSLTVLNAQIEKNELKVTPEIEEMVVTQIKNLPEKDYSEYGITDRSQLMNLHIGKPIPKYRIYGIINEKLKDVNTRNAFRMSDEDTLSLRFENEWIVPVISDEAPFLFGNIRFSDFGGNYIHSGTKNIIEHFRNYEHKDSIIGCVDITSFLYGMDLLIIRKENQDIFVQLYDEATGEYFKNEYRFSELLNLLKDLNLREKEAQRRYYEKVANKSELELTPEITEILVNQAYSSHINDSDKSLSEWGIKDRSQLEYLHPEKPIPVYRIVDEKLTFTGEWQVPVMSNGEPLFFTRVQLEDDGQYILTGGSGGNLAEIIHNYEYKNLIIGYLDVRFLPIGGSGYLIIRKDNQDIFVKMYDRATGEYLKNEYSFNEVLNLLKIK